MVWFFHHHTKCDDNSSIHGKWKWHFDVIQNGGGRIFWIYWISNLKFWLDDILVVWYNLWWYFVHTHETWAKSLIPWQRYGYHRETLFSWNSYGIGQISNPLPKTSTFLNQNDYKKTLHNWLRPWDKLVTQNWYKSNARERLGICPNIMLMGLF